MADYPDAINVPAHPSNYYHPREHGGVPNNPKGWVLHTPEEAADDIEVTPRYFQTPNISASTHFYLDSDGDIYQMVPEDCAAIANGVIGKPYPSWANPATSLNWQSVNVEIEGFGHSIHLTMPRGGPQWLSLLKLIKHRAAAYGIPLDREHIIGHYQVANNRSDPGALFPWDALIEDLNGEEEETMIRHNQTADWWTGRALAPSKYEMNARLDFALPAAARVVRFGIRLKRGKVRIFDGNALHAAGQATTVYFVADALLEGDSLWLSVTASAVIDFIECLGYWK